MNQEEFAEFAEAVQELTERQSGEIAALRALNDSLIATLCTAFPALTASLQKHLRALSGLEGEQLLPAERRTFERQVQRIQEHLTILQGI